ncbi:MAG: hypothetical protein EXR72_20220 [Myxococcales bacterium]|nr:hypothetical protein [Myxococcales bacterium]
MSGRPLRRRISCCWCRRRRGHRGERGSGFDASGLLRYISRVHKIPQTALVRADPSSLAPPTRPSARPGAFGRFFHAAGFPFRGIGFAFAHPGLLPLCFAPIVTTLVAVALLFGGAMRLASSLASYFGSGHGWLVMALLALVIGLVLLGIGYIGFVVVLSLANAPFCSLLSERVEALATGRPAPSRGVIGILIEAGRGLLHALLRVVVYLAISLPLWLVNLIIPPLAPIMAILSILATSYFLAYDYLDYPLSNRAAGAGTKWGYVTEHGAESLGFGGMTGLLLAIPLLNLFIAPFAAVGATLLYVEMSPSTNG